MPQAASLVSIAQADLPQALTKTGSQRKKNEDFALQ